MPAAAVTINPQIQSNFQGTFSATTEGYTQGDALDDPAIRFSLRQGFWALANTIPGFGGMAISEMLSPGLTGGSFPFTGESAELGSGLVPASNITGPGTAGNFTGFTVFNQSNALISSAQSRVPSGGAGMAINFYRRGSGARIPVQALLAAAQSWAGGVSDPSSIYWDTVNQWVTNAPGSGIIGPLPSVTLSEPPNLSGSRVVNYNNDSNGWVTSGFLNWIETGAAAVIMI